MLNGLDLFSGIGGLSIAIRPWARTVAYCEQDRYCQGVLLSRMWSNDLDAAPIWDDVRTLNAAVLPPIDIITGGFPCQDRSVAGTRRGLEGERSGLFYEVVRLTKEIKPAFVFVENPRGTRGDVEKMRSTFRALKYNTRAGALAAAEIGANHGRDRLWILAYSNRVELREQSRGFGWTQWKDSTLDFWPDWWTRKSGVQRVAHGIPRRLDRIRGLGNAVVPLQARAAFMRLMGLQGKE